jgi:ATP-dependent Lon protease
VAFIDEEELDEIETRFIEHGRGMAQEIEKARKHPANCLRFFYAKDPEELDMEGIGESFWEGCQCVFLSRPEIQEAILEDFPALDKHIRFKNFVLSRDDLTTVIRETQKSFAGDADLPLRLSLVAPFFFLKRDGISPKNFSPDLSPEELRLFANNYTLQGVKIKTCKPVLNRVYCELAQLESAHADACFFLGKRDWIYTVDLSFIPEKYRLDVKQAEGILNSCFQKWLLALDGNTRAAEDPD